MFCFETKIDAFACILAKRIYTNSSQTQFLPEKQPQNRKCNCDGKINSQDVSSVDERPAAVDEVDTLFPVGEAGKPGLDLGLGAVNNPVLPAPAAL